MPTEGSKNCKSRGMSNFENIQDRIDGFLTDNRILRKELSNEQLGELNWQETMIGTLGLNDFKNDVKAVSSSRNSIFNSKGL